MTMRFNYLIINYYSIYTIRDELCPNEKYEYEAPQPKNVSIRESRRVLQATLPQQFDFHQPVQIGFFIKPSRNRCCRKTNPRT